MEEQSGPTSTGQRTFCGRDIVILAVLLAITAGLRGWFLFHTEVLARDSIGFIRYSLQFETDNWMKVLRDNHQHPAYPLTILAFKGPARVWCNGSEAEAMSLSAQLASSTAAVLLVIPMYLLGTLLFHRPAGFAAAVLFQFLPVPAHVLSDGLSEALFLLLACAALLFAVLALSGNNAWLFAGCGLFCGLSYLTRPEGAMILAATVIVLFALQLVKAQRRSLRQLLTCTASMTAMAVVVGSPYVLATHRLTNKPSVQQWLGTEMPKAAVAPAAARDMQARLNLAPQHQLFASLFGINLNLRDTYSRRAVKAILGLGSELVKCFHYAAWAPALLGIWWFRRQAKLVPGLWVIWLVCAMLTFVLWRLAVQVGYLSNRHMLLLVMCGCFAVGAAIWEVPARIARWRKQRLPTSPADYSGQLVHDPATTESSVFSGAIAPSHVLCGGLLLVALLAPGMPKALDTLHGNRAGHHAAGLWLAANAAPNDAIEDDHCWAHYYAGRVFQESKPAPPPGEHQPTRFVVIGRRDREITLTWNNPGPVDEANLRAAGGQIVYHWPPQVGAGEAPLVVYALSPPPTRPPQEP